MRFDEEELDLPARRRRRNEPGFWHGLNRCVGFLVVLAFLLAVAITFYPVWRQQQDMRDRLASLERDLAGQKRLHAANQRQVTLLKTDPEYVETIARDRLDMMKPGETIFRIELPHTLGTSVQP